MKRCLTILILLAGLVLRASCQGTMTTMGTDFWFTYMDNTDPRRGIDMLKVYVSAPRTCSFQITNPNTGWTASGNVVPGTVSTISIPQIQGYDILTSTLMNKGLHLTATDTVSVYISTQGYTSFDECNVLPTPVLRDRYMVQSYPSDWFGSEFVVLAVEDSTWVDIHLSNATSDGAAADSILSVFFPVAGKTYQLKTPQVGDFSGTRVEARDCKKIAVFHGDVCVYIPNHAASTCDHVLEEAVPVYYWGQHFVAVGCGSPSFPDRVRITSLEDSCMVYRNRIYYCQLNSGQTYEYDLHSNATNHGYDYITTSKPASVNIFFSSTGNGTGDPSMLNIRPLEQSIHNVTFNTFNTAATTNHRIIVTLHADDAHLLRLDGNPVTQNFTTVASNYNYKFVIINVYNGSHTLSMNGGMGFTAHAYGLGNHESYAYTLGSSMNDLTNTIYVNDIPVPPDTIFDFCSLDTVSFYVTYNTTPDTIIWDFGDGVIVGGNNVSHIFQAPGLYNVSCHLTNDGSCLYSGTSSAKVRIYEPDTVEIDTVCCDSVIVWGGETYTTDTAITYLYTNTIGCDSVVIANIVFSQHSYTYTTDSTCGPEARDTLLTIMRGVNHQGCDSIEKQTLHIFAIQDTMIAVDGCDSIMHQGVWHTADFDDTRTYESIHGCDSIVHIHFQIHPSYNTTLNISISEGDTIVWLDGNEYFDNNNSAFVAYRSIYGCDSIINLNLTVRPDSHPHSTDSSSIWVPNVFTPEENSNTRFKVFSNDVTSMRVYIFTRDGEKVCEFDGLTEDWDGTHNGVMCAQESYVYLIEYVSKYKPAYKLRKIGTVLLLR